MKNAPAKHLWRMVKSEKKRLDKLYKKAANCPENRPFTENFVFWVKEADPVLKELRRVHPLPADASLLPRMFSAVFRLTEGGNVPDYSLLLHSLEPLDLRGDEIAYAELFFKAALLLRAAEGVERLSGEKGNAIQLTEARTEKAPEAPLFLTALESLRALSDFPFESLFAQLSPAEPLLLADEGYRLSDEQTKINYRRLLSRYAEKKACCEAEAAGDAFLKSDAQKIGIFSFLLKQFPKKRLPYLLFTEPLLAAVFAVLLGIALQNPLPAILSFFPFWAVTSTLLEPLFLKYSFKTPVPRIAMPKRIPNTMETVIAVTSLLPHAEKAKAMEAHLEEIYLSAGTGAFRVCLLADFYGADRETTPRDKGDLAAMRAAIARLNARYGAHFLLAVRPRVWSKAQNSYIGFDRKRGAISDFLHALRGDASAFCCLDGATDALQNVRYLLTLDSDTALSFDALPALLAAAEHPDNLPKLNEEGTRVESGYGIFVPRVEPALSSAFQTQFSRLFCGVGGISGYDGAVGEFYGDLFGESLFVGKGLLRVDSALVLLENAFRDETVLSHDILEGELLRTALVPEAQVTDAFPTNAKSYFARMGRWMRGDAQNAVFLSRKIQTNLPPCPGEEKIPNRKNPFSLLSRWKIFSNLHRNLTPISLFLLFFCSLFLEATAAKNLCVLTLILTLWQPLFTLLRLLFKGEGFSLGFHFFGKSLSALQKTCADLVLSLLYLPRTAYTATVSFVLGLYRRLISHQNTLEWMTAADGEQIGGGFTNSLRASLPSLLSFLLFFCFGTPFLKGISFFFLAEPFFSVWSKRAPKGKESAALTTEETDYLLNYGSAMWQYYKENATAEHHYLPPDNVQMRPIYRVADRTSPTNIGLFLASVLAARDLNFIDTETMVFYFRQVLTTIEKLPKNHGNLYNWYSTKTLKPLSPAFVSAVDSGNFLCALTAVSEGLKEYEAECPALGDILARIQKILQNTDLAFLYDKRKNLFYIGFDAENLRFTPAHYDLLMSEARMMSYYAVARRQVPKKHWLALSRTVSQNAVRSGALAWSGTAFEYFMPFLFLKSPENSLSREALEFCIRAQRRYAEKRGIPFGISESGYYAFDEIGNYQYKAHGVPDLALRPDPFAEPVVAPYASFLFLPIANKQRVVKNLLRLENLHAVGAYGFFEALDFTDRSTESGNEEEKIYTPHAVESFMAHHIGMSLLALDNTVKDGIMQKRFLRNPAMHGAQSLLEERVPPVRFSFGRRKEKFSKVRVQKPKSETGSAACKQGLMENANTLSPVLPLTVYANGNYALVLDEDGRGFSRLQERSITREADAFSEDFPSGMFAYFKTENGVLPLTKAAAPAGIPKETFSSALLEKHAVFLAKCDELHVQTTVSLDADSETEFRKFSFYNPQKTAVEGEFYLYFEPSLCKVNDEIAHRAFQKLFVTAAYQKESDSVLFRRHTKENEAPLFAACGFLEPLEKSLLLNRTKALSRGEFLDSITRADFRNTDTVSSGDVCFAALVKIYLPPKKAKEITFYLTAATQENDLQKQVGAIKAAAVSYAFRPSPRLCPEEKEKEANTAFVLPYLFKSSPLAPYRAAALSENQKGISFLWAHGISGDFPIVTVFCKPEEDYLALSPYLRLFSRLKYAHLGFDLVVLLPVSKAEITPFLATLQKRLQTEFPLPQNGSGGNLFVLSEEEFSPSELSALLAFSAFIDKNPASRAVLRAAELKLQREKAQRERSKPSVLCAEAPKSAKTSRTDSGFLIAEKPNVPWSYILANPSFATLLSDSSLGASFALNARLMRLTAFRNDALRDNRGELLFLRQNGVLYDILKKSAVEFGNDKAVYRAETPFCTAKVTVTVPRKGMAKLVSLNIQNTASHPITLQCAYYIEPFLGENETKAVFLQSRRTKTGALLQNPCAENYPGFLSLRLEEAEKEIFSLFGKEEFFQGNWDAQGSLPAASPCAAVGTEITLLPKQEKTLRFVLAFGKTEESALYPFAKMENSIEQNRIEINTPDEALNALFNNFLVNQIKEGRLFSRTGFYQSSGAFGFRDQLQDAASLLFTEPALCRRQIYRACVVQFPEGDILHWWHRSFRGGFSGVRTHCSDDRLWLPYALAQYVEMTGDISILKKQIPFLEGEPLQEGEGDRYAVYHSGKDKANVLEHAERALALTLQRTGAHGLLRIGTGDWNDGFSAVGKEGRGESVWLTQFAALVLSAFSALYDRLGEAEKQKEALCHAEKLKALVDAVAYEDDRYLRAFFDDGTPLGSKNSTACQLDSLTQSFAVFAKFPNQNRVKLALLNAYHTLLDTENGVFRLFAPAFSGEDKRAGYIAAYPEGIRENGGQYTHAAVWFCRALFEAGLLEEGETLLHLLNPMKKWENPELFEKYKLEPYYFAGDVYESSGEHGRGGWSLYTGAAGQFYAFFTAVILGLEKHGDKLYFHPVCPPSFGAFSYTIFLNGARLHVEILPQTKPYFTVDGKEAEFLLLDGKNHEIKSSRFTGKF